MKASKRKGASGSGKVQVEWAGASGSKKVRVESKREHVSRSGKARVEVGKCESKREGTS